MRKSRVLLAGVAVAAAGVTTSAFTAGNTFTPDDNVAGYGEAHRHAASTVTNIAYILDAHATRLCSTRRLRRSTENLDAPWRRRTDR